MTFEQSERAIGMLTAGISAKDVARHFQSHEYQGFEMYCFVIYGKESSGSSTISTFYALILVILRRPSSIHTLMPILNTVFFISKLAAFPPYDH